MPSQEEKDPSLFSNSQENLESPFLDEEIFVKENEAEAEPHLETLQRESPFRYAFEEARAVRPEPEDLEEQIDEEEWVDEEDFFRDEAEAQDEEALSEESMEGPYDEETLDEEGEGQEQVFEATALDEESVISDEDWTEAQEEESDYPLEEAEYADEEAEYDDESLIDPDEEEVDWASLESEEATGIPAGREEVAKVPLLKSHRGSGPDLILSWNDMAGQPQSVDVVVHLHGYSLRAGKLLNISRDIVPRSGLDWSDPEKVDRTPGRSEPTLTLLPRGHFFGGKSGRGYSFPALVTETGLKQLIDFGLGHFARHISATNVALRRLIISSHSGGAAALLRILRHNDPREVHVFDGMYQDPAELVRWAKARIERDSKALEAGAESPERYMLERGGALRVLFRPGSATERYSLTVDNALLAAIPAGSPMRRWYRVEQTSLGHLLIPRRYGWRLLANAAAELPGASAPRQARTKELAFEEEAPARVIFPSGESLGVLTGLPEAKDQDYWDPTGSGNPLLDTGTAQKNKKLSPSFTVRELTTSGGVSADIGRIDPKLVESLQRLKDHVGKGVTITSGYRSWKRNKQVYAGRKNRDGTPKKPTLSQHCGGRAADITITGMNGLDIGKAAIDACGPNIGVGLGNTFAHIDVRGFAAAWNYGGVKDSWIAEIKRYQQAKGGKGKPPPAGLAKPTQPGAVRPAAELVRFAQRVLNAAEREQLDDDGDLGRLTRDALERFRRKYNLGTGGVLDGKTELALAQRALEEIAQQSLFAQPGVPDAKSDQSLRSFKAERGLGSDATLNAATRAALADALARRGPSRSAQVTGQSPRPSDGPSSTRFLTEASKDVSFKEGKWGGWKGRQTISTAFIRQTANIIRDKYDVAVAVAAEVETGGAFDKVQMYDKGILSWGIKQWTLHRGSLQALLRFINSKLSRSLWTEIFSGIDFQNGKILISGTAYPVPQKDDDAADRALRKTFRGGENPEQFDKEKVDHWLTVFARAARHPDIKRLQFEYAVMSLKKNLNKGLGEVLKARNDIKTSDVHKYLRVGHYVENSPIALALFNGMETQNPKWTYRYLKRIVDQFAGRYGNTYDTSRWPSDWQKKFAQDLQTEFAQSGVACWGKKALEKPACKDPRTKRPRTSRTEKILRAYNELSRHLPL